MKARLLVLFLLLASLLPASAMPPQPALAREEPLAEYSIVHHGVTYSFNGTTGILTVKNGGDELGLLFGFGELGNFTTTAIFVDDSDPARTIVTTESTLTLEITVPILGITYTISAKVINEFYFYIANPYAKLDTTIDFTPDLPIAIPFAYLGLNPLGLESGPYGEHGFRVGSLFLCARDALALNPIRDLATLTISFLVGGDIVIDPTIGAVEGEGAPQGFLWTWKEVRNNAITDPSFELGLPRIWTDDGSLASMTTLATLRGLVDVARGRTNTGTAYDGAYRYTLNATDRDTAGDATVRARFPLSSYVGPH